MALRKRSQSRSMVDLQGLQEMAGHLDLFAIIMGAVPVERVRYGCRDGTRR